MIDIIKLLIEFGVDFNYEIKNNDKESLISNQIGLILKKEKNNFHFTHRTFNHQFNDEEEEVLCIEPMVKEICIEEIN
jgi:hypothetical protein